LGEVAEQRPFLAGPERELAAVVLEHAAEAVPLRLVLPAVAGRQLGDELGLHGREGDVWAGHLPGRLCVVGALDGTWDVRRAGGALPPLAGVRKRIAGESGYTEVGP